ncbi:protein of unknown function [Hyphomicrobium sp. MC1]|nr:protein of unknown function [Hyphomicrobium sp. MC1]
MSTGTGENASHIATSVHKPSDSIRIFSTDTLWVASPPRPSPRRHFLLPSDSASKERPTYPASEHPVQWAGFRAINDDKKTAGPLAGPLFTVANMQQGEKLAPLIHKCVMRSWP